MKQYFASKIIRNKLIIHWLKTFNRCERIYTESKISLAIWMLLSSIGVIKVIIAYIQRRQCILMVAFLYAKVLMISVGPVSFTVLCFCELLSFYLKIKFTKKSSFLSKGVLKTGLSITYDCWPKKTINWTSWLFTFQANIWHHIGKVLILLN